MLAVFALTLNAQQPAALTTDPVHDAAAPASMVQIAVPSHGENLLGVLYLAAGAKPHPTVVLMHGFPGYEQNLDLAQAIRRAGWNVLAVHYRGSWGVRGQFSFTHTVEDADAEVAFLREPANIAKYRVDTKKIVVIGHSMGGFMVASAAAHDPKIAAVVMISAWNIAAPFMGVPAAGKQAAVAKFVQGQTKNDLSPLAGTSAEALGEEVFANRDRFNFLGFAPALGMLPVLIVTSDDGLAAENEKLAAALKQQGNRQVQLVHYPTDHGYSDQRVQLTTVILNFLAKLT
jgi:pimeloyl-ACP methyl ester carboxylesterase